VSCARERKDTKIDPQSDNAPNHFGYFALKIKEEKRWRLTMNDFTLCIGLLQGNQSGMRAQRSLSKKNARNNYCLFLILLC
jgi:hypothetical protein